MLINGMVAGLTRPFHDRPSGLTGRAVSYTVPRTVREIGVGAVALGLTLPWAIPPWMEREGPPARSFGYLGPPLRASCRLLLYVRRGAGLPFPSWEEVAAAAAPTASAACNIRLLAKVRPPVGICARTASAAWRRAARPSGIMDVLETVR